MGFNGVSGRVVRSILSSIARAMDLETPWVTLAYHLGFLKRMTTASR